MLDRIRGVLDLLEVDTAPLTGVLAFRRAGRSGNFHLGTRCTGRNLVPAPRTILEVPATRMCYCVSRFFDEDPSVQALWRAGQDLYNAHLQAQEYLDGATDVDAIACLRRARHLLGSSSFAAFEPLVSYRDRMLIRVDERLDVLVRAQSGTDAQCLVIRRAAAELRGTAFHSDRSDHPRVSRELETALGGSSALRLKMFSRWLTAVVVAAEAGELEPLFLEQLDSARLEGFSQLESVELASDARTALPAVNESWSAHLGNLLVLECQSWWDGFVSDLARTRPVLMVLPNAEAFSPSVQAAIESFRVTRSGAVVVPEVVAEWISHHSHQFSWPPSPNDPYVFLEDDSSDVVDSAVALFDPRGDGEFSTLLGALNSARAL